MAVTGAMTGLSAVLLSQTYYLSPFSGLTPMIKGVSIIWEYSEFYRDNGSGELEPIRQTKVETAFSF